MSKQCIIMRGISGSGKSTYIQTNYPNAVVCSADNFHMKRVNTEDGTVTHEYQYDVSKSAIAHSCCLNDFIGAVLGERVDCVVVDNTNLRIWEFQNYIKLARLVGYKVTIVEMRGHTTETGPEFCASRNQHAVPVDVVMKMHDSFEELNVQALPRSVQVVKVLVMK